ncbi:MAG: acriflavin resistance protein [Hyphomicrobiales bacterium]|nr:MAG: acriflavin resistance protein [Hyphomicrobiales bacterium]
MTTGLKTSALIRVFARHHSAPNLLMAMLLILGALALMRLNTQIFPTMLIPQITVSVSWPGASAEDVEKTILKVLEPELRYTDDLDDMTAVAREGSAFIAMEFKRNADMTKALSDVEMAVASVTTLPKDAELPRVRRITHYERIARVMITGDLPEFTLKSYARMIRDEMLEAGIDHITLEGARDEEISVEIPARQLRRLDLTVSDIAARIRANTQDRPSGTLEGRVDKQLRMQGKADTVEDIGRIEVRPRASGERIMLRDIAEIKDSFDDNDLNGYYKGKRAIQLVIQRSLTADALKTNRILDDYLAKAAPQWPKSLQVIKYDVRAEHLMNRIKLLLKNGVGGLVLVLIILFIFLNSRIAFWVALGIPVAMMGTVVVMWVSGQSINMVSLFAMILTLGIIVDDAIVVGEHTATRSEMGDTPLEAAERGASRMLAPVIAATLTTVAAFLPTFFITGRIGQVMVALPLVVISVLIASLVECFFILPGHLRHSIKHTHRAPSRFRRGFDRNFARLRDGPFRRLVALSYHWRYSTLAAAVAILIVTVGIVASGRITFHFFPVPPAENLRARIVMGAGTPRAETIKAVAIVEAALQRAEKKLTGGKERLINSGFVKLGQLGHSQGDNLAQLDIQLTATETRTIATNKIVAAWRKEIPKVPGAERIAVGGRRAGPPGDDIDIRLTGEDIPSIKSAALEITELLSSYPGVMDVADDLPYGKQDVLIELTPRGAALGFTTEGIGQQLRNAFEGAIARRFARNGEEITVRVQRKKQGGGIRLLRDLYLKSPGGAHVPLTEIANIREKSGFSIINRRNGKNVISVTGEVNKDVTSAVDVQAALEQKGLKEIAQKYHVKYRFAGRSEDRREAFADLKLGGLIALVLIFLVLAWVFASYSRPFIVMLIIPFGIVGTIWGHMLMGMALTLLSIIGLLGLAGIIVNDSIILVSQVDERLGRGQSMAEAAIGAAQDRLRAVLLTSLTTIGGLMPLMFESSLQAQFLLPIAITMVFGLAVATVLILIIVPASLGVLADVSRLFGKAPMRPEISPAE